MSILRTITLLCLILSVSFTYTPESGAYRYIDIYRDLAIVEMYRSGIPASITLAQGLHESNYGTSDLAVHANNHFGIKCKSNWIGSTFYHKDDDYDKRGNLMNSCFRSYEADLDSYVDHSNFLMSRSNYADLFNFSQTDYKNWAYGLKRSGYATDPNYADKLIKKIERYGLDQYDHWENPLNR
jgi:flagellum-specific peptidoglycan hydrolase FlgJ